MKVVSDVKCTLLELVRLMNEAGAQGIKIEFNIGGDPVTLESKLERFVAYQKIKLEN